jgi:predicted O-methyltransferase YrrM
LAPEDLSEARWTPPRADCPHPERWHSTDDESTEIEVTDLVAGFVRALQPDLVVETGAAFGQTSVAIGSALFLNGQGRLVTCEPDGSRFDEARIRCRNLPVTVYAYDSMRMISEISEPVGFAWLDSLLHLRVGEFKALRPWLLRGAIVAFHDTGPQHGLRPSIEQLARDRMLRLIHLPTPRGVIFGEVL